MNSMLASSRNTSPTSQSIPKNCELFVGDLSFFCTEQHLFDLFEQFGDVVRVKIVRNNKRSRSLAFGFVVMSTPQQAREIAKLLNNHLFMGRHMKVESTDNKGLHSISNVVSKSLAFEVHVHFTVRPDVSVIPTETFLRKAFLSYGNLVDIVIREYNINNADGRQQGYGFITFSDLPTAIEVLTHQEKVFNGVHLKCTPGHNLQQILNKQAFNQQNSVLPLQQQNYQHFSSMNQPSLSALSTDSTSGSSSTFSSFSSTSFPNSMDTNNNKNNIYNNNDTLFSSLNNNFLHSDNLIFDKTSLRCN